MALTPTAVCPIIPEFQGFSRGLPSSKTSFPAGVKPAAHIRKAAHCRVKNIVIQIVKQAISREAPAYVLFRLERFPRRTLERFRYGSIRPFFRLTEPTVGQVIKAQDFAGPLHRLRNFKKLVVVPQPSR